MEVNAKTLAYIQVLYCEYTCKNCGKVYKQYEDGYAHSHFNCPYCDYLMNINEVAMQLIEEIDDIKKQVKKQYAESKHHEDNIYLY